MAAPETTVDGMKAAVVAFNAHDSNVPGAAPGRRPGSPVMMPTYVIPPGWVPAGGLPNGAMAAATLPSTAAHRSRDLLRGQESGRLGQLRGHQHGASCSLHSAPSQSRPSYASNDPGDDMYDDLDKPAQDALNRLQLPDFDVAVTRGALRYVRFLTRTRRGRDLFASWLKRSGRYRDLIQRELRQWNLPEDVMWVAMIESGFSATAKSPAGAMGLWQFMQGTGKVYGLNVNQYVDERRNPVQATRAAVHHLRDLHQRFGSWDLAFAAYNMGYQQLLDRIERTNTADFGELVRQRVLPKETAAYVPKIVAAAIVANNLDRYGFGDIKLYGARHVAQLEVPGGTKLAIVAKAAGVSTATMRKFNPHIRGKYIPPRGSYPILLPPDRLSKTRAALPTLVKKNVRLTDSEVLNPTELLALGKDAGKVRYNAWNEDENLLRNLPKPKRRSVSSLLKARRRKVEHESNEMLSGLVEDFKPTAVDREPVMYRVGPGDTLLGLARQFAVDVDDVARDNGLEADDKLREGALLRLMVKRDILKKWGQKRGQFGRRKSKKTKASTRKSKRSTAKRRSREG